jgi:predicted hydrocarbon binding protein
MYGLVNAAIQEFVSTHFDVDTWARIRKEAGVETEVFNRMSPYPDSVTFDLVAGASRVLGITPDEVMKAFGEFWVLYTGRVGYGPLFALAGSNLRDFLFNLDNLHTRVGQNFDKLRPPSFRCEDVDAHSLSVHYHSERVGLCPMVVGLLDGLGKHFKTEVKLQQTACIREGADHCVFLVTMSPSHV